MDNHLPFSSKTEDISFSPKITLQSKGKLFLLNEPWVLGILNLTPDSFYLGSRITSGSDQVLNLAEKMIIDGADILDIGGYSSRPSADFVSEEEELKRTIGAIEQLKKHFPNSLLSIDTFRSKVAHEAVIAGADMVNDISAGELDHGMIPAVGKLSVPYIAMHMRGNPKTMQKETAYENIILEIMNYFSKKMKDCRKSGIKDVIIDPGLGFAKTLDQNYWILRNLAYFKTIQAPILVGLSRKSMIYKKLGSQPENALNGTTALNMAALINGANILRVHDVKEAKETIKLYKELYP
ncbi:dihydropteroate synthase [Aquiflexum sp.]|uniref:dihydropteroate synthase n=1 Tax=Aquiflexum sp. TaxID=1872584 RepID=UPI003593278B